MIDFAKITPSLFVGTCPSNGVDIKQISSMGVTGVLNLQTDADFIQWRVNFPEIEQTSFDLDLVMQRLPIIDFDDADLSHYLPAAVNQLHRMIALEHIVYLHCTAGRDRSPTVAAAYLALHQSMDVDAAVNQLKSLRDCRPKTEIIRQFVATCV